MRLTFRKRRARTAPSLADERRRTGPFLTPAGILMLVGHYNCQRLMLEVIGSKYPVTIARTGREARTLLRTYRYRLAIVTNLGVPVHDAIATVGIVPTNHAYPVVVISAVWTDELRRICQVKRLICFDAPFDVHVLRRELAGELDEPAETGER